MDERTGLELVFKYFFTAGAGIGLGAAVTFLPALYLKTVIQERGLFTWLKRRKK